MADPPTLDSSLLTELLTEKSEEAAAEVAPARPAPPPAPVAAPESSPTEPESERATESDPGEAGAVRRDPLSEEIERQLNVLRKRRGRVDEGRKARLLVEQALTREWAGDPGSAAALYREAVKSAPDLLPAVRGLRWALSDQRSEAESELPFIIDHEAQLLGRGPERSQRTVERALIFESKGAAARRDAIDALRSALETAPGHAEALHALDRVLTVGGDDVARATGLAKLAAAYADDPLLVAGYLMIQGRLYEKLGSNTNAEEAYSAAVAADTRPGPALESLKRLLERRGAYSRLRDLLAEEAQVEDDTDRAVRLLFEAARISEDHLDDPTNALALYQAAVTRSPGHPAALDALVRLLETSGDTRDANAYREARIAQESDSTLRFFEYRRLAEAYESLGDLDRAADALQQAQASDPANAETLTSLDRVYEALGQHDERLELWLNHAASAPQQRVRAAAYVRAARIAAVDKGNREEGIRHLRAAWANDPTNTEAFDDLTRLLSDTRGQPIDEERARGLLELYLQASQAVTEPARRIAYLEKVAAIYEDQLDDPSHAADLYEKVLLIDPSRRFTLLAWQRSLERAERFRELAEALESEAEQASDPAHASVLRVRAAEVWSNRAGSIDRATAVLRRALEAAADRTVLLRALWRIQERAGRWDSVAETLSRLVETVAGGATSRAALPLWLELAEAHSRSGKISGAMSAWRAVLEIEPGHPVAAYHLAQALRMRKDWAALATLEESFAAAAKDRQAAAEAYARAGTVFERQLRDEDSALHSYRSALEGGASAPAAAWEGFLRIAERRKLLKDLEVAFGERMRQDDGSTRRALALCWGEILVRLGGETQLAVKALEAAVASRADDDENDANTRARTLIALLHLEELYRRTGDNAAIEQTLERLTAASHDPTARKGFLWEQVRRAHQRRSAPEKMLALHMSLCAIDPADPAALRGIWRAAERLLDGLAPDDEKGVAGSNLRGLIVWSLRAQIDLCGDAATRSWLRLQLARFQEVIGELPRALAGYRSVLAAEPDSPSAIDGARRLARSLGDHATALEAAVRAAESEPDPAWRSTHLLEAAKLAPHLPDSKLGDETSLVVRALVADPDSEAAADAVMLVFSEAGNYRRLVELLEEAASLAKRPERIVALSRHAAAVAHAHLSDDQLAVTLLLRARKIDWQDISLGRELADRQMALGAWVEAAGVLRNLVTQATPEEHREEHLRARLQLAELYEGPLEDMSAALSELRAAVRLAPRDSVVQMRLAKALIRQRAWGPAESALEDLLAIDEIAATTRAEALAMLGEVRAARGDHDGAEEALRQAIVHDPDPANEPHARLEAYFRARGDDDQSVANALAELAASPGADPRVLLRLGEIEVHGLQDSRAGLDHLRQAVERFAALPGNHPLRGEMSKAQLAYAQALFAVGARDEASKELRAILIANPTDAAALETAESTLAALGRHGEARVIRELRLYQRMVPGLDQWRARPPEIRPARGEPLDGDQIRTHIFPSRARIPAVDVLALISGELAKVYAPDLRAHGVSAAMRIDRGSGHPWRAWVDQAAAALGAGEIELYQHHRPDPRCIIENTSPPTLLVPAAFQQLPERELVFALGRQVAKIATRTYLAAKLAPVELRQLIAAAASPASGGELGRRVAKALPRKVRRHLEGIAATVRPFDAEALMGELDRGYARAAFVWTGDLVAALDHLRRVEEIDKSEIMKPGGPLADLIQFALGPEAATLRRRLGSVPQAGA